MEEEQPISDLEDPSEEELQQMKSEYEKMKKQQQEIESLQKFQFFKKTSLSDLVTLNTAQVITGIKSFTQPITANKIIKLGGTSNQILLANGDTIEKDQLDYEPIENVRYSSIAYGMYESRAWGTLTTGTATNIPLNAVLFAQKVYGYSIDWTGAIAMDCYINPNGNVIINTLYQINLTDDFCVQRLRKLVATKWIQQLQIQNVSPHLCKFFVLFFYGFLNEIFYLFICILRPMCGARQTFDSFANQLKQLAATDNP
ncbi:MAG: hypothetical protein EZS28_033242, partial [Streblomastix strix]